MIYLFIDWLTDVEYFFPQEEETIRKEISKKIETDETYQEQKQREVCFLFIDEIKFHKQSWQQNS